MADPIPLPELEIRIAGLPPVSRGAHLGAPAIYAARLAAIWRVDGADDVELGQAFRLLDEAAVAGAILRAAVANGDPRHWPLPPLADLLVELREAAWQAALAGDLLVAGVRGLRGTRPRAILARELPGLTPDWELSRLVSGSAGVFFAVRVRRPPTEPAPAPATRRRRWARAVVKPAMEAVAAEYPLGVQPAFPEIWRKLKGRLGDDLPRAVAKKALKDYAQRLTLGQGQHPTRSPR